MTQFRDVMMPDLWRSSLLTGSLCLALMGAGYSQEHRASTQPGEQAGERDEKRIQQGTFRVSTELVEIRAVVTDRHGRIVEDLNKEDFELLENDQPQEISFFSVSKIEEEQDKPGPSITQSQRNSSQSGIREELIAPSVRSTILYVDNLHLTFSELNWVKQSLRHFIDEKMTEQDTIAIMTSDGNLGIAQQFTRDRQILRYAIEQIRLGPMSWETPFSATLAGRIMRGDSMALEEGKGILKSDEYVQDKFGSLTRARAAQIFFGASYFRETMITTLKGIIEQITGMPGQRMIAIISGGFTQDGRDGWPKYDEVRSAIDLAARSGVVIYSIDGKGLTAENREPQKLDPLVALAKDTGGELYMNTNDLSGVLGRAFNANRFYYVLAYYLKPGNDGAKFRQLRVRIKNHPEYMVRTAKGYSPLQKAKRDEKEGTPQQHLLALSSIVFVDSPHEVNAEMDLTDEVKRIAMVHGVRLFQRNSTCAYTFRVYGSGKASTSRELLFKEELSKNGKPIMQSHFVPLSRDAQTLDGEVQISVSRNIDLAGLDPGMYQLSISVKDIRSRKIAQRTTSFGIE